MAGGETHRRGVFLNFDAEHGNCEVGCWLEPAGTGRGLVTRAMRILIDWAVEERGIHRVEWIAASANVPSVNGARRLGMTRDAVLRESYPHPGRTPRHGGLVGTRARVAGGTRA